MIESLNPITGTWRVEITENKLGCWLCPGGAVVEHSIHKPKIKGSNPTTGTWRDEMENNRLGLRSEVVEHSTHNPDIKGLDPHHSGTYDYN